MKVLLVLLVTIALGGFVGAANAWRQAADPGPPFVQLVSGNSDILFPPDPDAGKGIPEVELPNGAEFDFGVMGVAETGKHEFVVKNNGTGTLVLTFKDKTCSCTGAEIGRSSIPPGESSVIKFDWQPKYYASEFRQSATFATNDPDHDEVIVSVVGRVIPLVRTEPEDVSLADVVAGSTRSTDFIIFGYESDDLQVIGDPLWLESETAEYFDLTVAPDEEARQNEPNAKTALRCTVRLKPGMPLGPFHQKLQLKLNETRIPDLEVSIAGTVVGEITIGGRAFDKSRNLVMVEAIQQAEGYETQLNIYVKGDQHRDIEVALDQVDPADVLKVQLDEPQHLAPVSIHRLQISIPRNSQPISRMGSTESPLGEIRLKTTHPDVPQLLIYVRFAVIE
jgi:hypothetical protein